MTLIIRFFKSLYIFFSLPFPVIPGNESLQFPFTNFWNGFSHSLPVPEFWEWFISLPSCSQILGMDFFYSLPVSEFREWIFFLSFSFPNFGNGIFRSRSRTLKSHSRSCLSRHNGFAHWVLCTLKTLYPDLGKFFGVPLSTPTFTPLSHFWVKIRAPLGPNLQSWALFELFMISGVKFWGFSFFRTLSSPSRSGVMPIFWKKEKIIRI